MNNSKKEKSTNKKLGELRPNQIITSFGPGSVIEALNDSLTPLDISYWNQKGKVLRDGRLASYLNVDKFIVPPTSHFYDIPVTFFPYWHVCSNKKCNSLFDLREHFNHDKYLKDGPRCPHCNSRAYPARFITICEDGHMSDFPWRWWVHNGQKTTHKGDLKLISTGTSSTLSDIIVKCSCGAQRSLAGAANPKYFKGLQCSGHHPFRPFSHNDKCTKPVIPSQRGSSNVYFPIIKSALSIPPWINPIYDEIDCHMESIETAVEIGGDSGLRKIYDKYFKNYEWSEFKEAFHNRRKQIKEFLEIKEGEYQAITHHNDPFYRTGRKHFSAEEDEEIPRSLQPFFNRIIRVTRLREIRVLLGFTRLEAPDPEADKPTHIVSLKNEKSNEERWLPASEVNGEGIFIEFNRETVNKWAATEEIKELSEKFVKSYKEYCQSRGWSTVHVRDAVYVLLHTFSHLLIKQMGISSGYSSASIRERIYFGDHMAGVLLYTGGSDKEGSLGGIVELGNPTSIMNLLREAFEEALICTNDPECMLNHPEGTDANGASCYSCTMVSETCCENGNRMLDRGLVVPLPGRENQAYFRELVNGLCQTEI